MKRHFFVDYECLIEIQIYLDDIKFKKKLDYIIERILNLNTSYYEDYSKLLIYHSISEIRIFPNGMNARIYCKEIYMEDGCTVIIAAKFLKKKKSMKIDKNLKVQIKLIENYTYEIDI